MSAVDEMNRHDGIIECTPQAVAELVAEIKRLRAALTHIKDGTWNRGTGEMVPPREYARRALEPKP